MVLLGSQLICGSFVIGVLDIRATRREEHATPPARRAEAA
jgi:hypothetical protein